MEEYYLEEYSWKNMETYAIYINNLLKRREVF